MGRILASSVGTVVAAGAITCDVHVVEIGRQPADCGVTIVAVVATVYVGWMLARRDYAVMTCTTVSHHLGMVHGESGSPYIRRVAIFTDITCLYMGDSFSRSFYAVMTAYAVSCDIHVVEIRR